MVLVAYSDSEGSDNEDISKQNAKPAPKSASTNFAVDKSNPKKIRVNLTEITAPTTEREDGEPAAKRARIGAGAFSGFNAMLPPPKRDSLAGTSKNASNLSTRKVFSLKTGAEPAFSRESDAELRELFDGQSQADETIPSSIPKPAQLKETSTTPSLPIQGKPMMFKPLSVSRNNNKKKKTASHLLPAAPQSTIQQKSNSSSLTQKEQSSDKPPEPPQKISLFSSGPSELPPDPVEDDELDQDDEIVEVLDDSAVSAQQPMPNSNQSESLSDIASSLNLSAAEKRQLFGRNGNTGSKIINFNTDMEYAANQAHIAAGEQVQHNPVRAIASGKHSLKALVASAQGQKDALEESFASGRRNKREAGSKYGW